MQRISIRECVFTTSFIHPASPFTHPCPFTPPQPTASVPAQAPDAGGREPPTLPGTGGCHGVHFPPHGTGPQLSFPPLPCHTRCVSTKHPYCGQKKGTNDFGPGFVPPSAPPPHRSALLLPGITATPQSDAPSSWGYTRSSPTPDPRRRRCATKVTLINCHSAAAHHRSAGGRGRGGAFPATQCPPPQAWAASGPRVLGVSTAPRLPSNALPELFAAAILKREVDARCVVVGPSLFTRSYWPTPPTTCTHTM